MKIALTGLLFTTLLLYAASFEVASIKPASPDEAGYSGGDGRNGVVKMWNVTLKQCISSAYNVPEGQILGGPKWIDELSYDILAKADHPADEHELWTMLQPLLADRFKLQLHHETRTVSGYVLTVAKGGIKATPADPGKHSFGNGGRGFIDSGASQLSVLTIRLSALLGRPVVDMTGDERKFDFHLKWAPDDAQTAADSASPDRPSLFTALQQQLGLRLESGKVLADVLVVDHAELPSDN
jgi:uncharacterized protein (TIGR03435 family)